MCSPLGGPAGLDDRASKCLYSFAELFVADVRSRPQSQNLTAVIAEHGLGAKCSRQLLGASGANGEKTGAPVRRDRQRRGEPGIDIERLEAALQPADLVHADRAEAIGCQPVVFMKGEHRCRSVM